MYRNFWYRRTQRSQYHVRLRYVYCRYYVPGAHQVYDETTNKYSILTGSLLALLYTTSSLHPSCFFLFLRPLHVILPLVACMMKGQRRHYPYSYILRVYTKKLEKKYEYSSTAIGSVLLFVCEQQHQLDGTECEPGAGGDQPMVLDLIR